ncbi:ribbon-helix-helix domain-containing protein [Nostoc sp. NIES-2111]
MAKDNHTGEEMKPGRKPTGIKPTTVRLDPEIIQEIDEVAGKAGRAAFIRDAVQHLLSVRKILNRYRQSDE